jgi:hypothetical protein
MLPSKSVVPHFPKVFMLAMLTRNFVIFVIFLVITVIIVILLIKAHRCRSPGPLRRLGRPRDDHRHLRLLLRIRGIHWQDMKHLQALQTQAVDVEEILMPVTCSIWTPERSF